MGGFKELCSGTLFPTDEETQGASLFNRCIVVLILLGLLLTAIETEAAILEKYGDQLLALELALSIVFALEYVLRVWCCTSRTGVEGTKDRLKYCLSIGALIDLVAFLPSLLTIGASDAFILRIVRLAKLARFARLGKYNTAMIVVERSIRSHWRELVVSASLSLCLLFVSATVLYLVEGELQPENFGSIPRALWWSVVTLTTVGYGDVYPISALGKVCAGFIAFVGVGTVALPAGILAAAFSETYKSQSRKEDKWDSDSERVLK